jgi:hypothetical protein
MTAADWITGFAREADADFCTWELLQGDAAVPQCHKLLFLQMACEKLCKAHLIATGTPAEKVQSSHGYIAKPLPVVIKQELSSWKKSVGRRVMQSARHLAQEIEVLNPALDRNGQRPDNCEYPWQDHGGTVRSPLDWSFAASQLLTTQGGPSFLKLVRLAINRLL